ncbi:MAG TPA: tellurite resistance TerB family protein [Gammaproteobacteria bacterium]
MNTTSLLDQLLKSGRSLLDGTGSATAGAQPRVSSGTGGGLGDALKGALGGLNSELGKGALMGGALGLLLGSKRVRKMGGNILAYGGMAALGAVAYRAYADWQRNQAGQPAADAAPPQPGQLSAAESETHSRAVLKALVAAAKSDGHIEDRERELIEAEIASIDGDPELRAWLDGELRRPLDPADVARAAATPELAAEMYLASVLVADDQSPMERMYLDELARQLKLDAGLKAQLEANARAQG